MDVPETYPLSTPTMPRLTLALGSLLCLGGLASAQDLTFWPGYELTPAVGFGTGEPDPGGEASKVKLLRLVKTPMGANDGRLFTVFGEANNDEPIWDSKGGEHFPRDIFARFSDDEGRTWSTPVNLSNTAKVWSARTDWDGDGEPETYYGDSAKPNVFASGNTVVVSWVDTYSPEATWTFGDTGESTVQGSVLYPDIEVYPEQREVPYSSVYLAISYDGGSSWTYGGDNPPLQLTYGRRDAIGDVHRGSGKRWIVTWQEDPEGLQTGEAEGPGEGSSGAKVTKGTDIWYTFTTDITVDPEALRTNRTPISDHSRYDGSGSNGFPLIGSAGTLSNHGASRPNAFLANDGGVFKALIAYEETKGVPDIEEGKTVQYHAFPFDAPPSTGTGTELSGVAGTQLSPQLENSRRVRFVAQGPDGVNPAIAIFWKQGTGTQGAPSDIVLKTSTSFDEAAVAAAPARNLSTNTPSASTSDMDLETSADPLEDSRAHRAVLRGSMLIVGYTYTWNGPLARYTDLANYDFWIRRSLDGGQTWEAPQNLSNLPTTTVNVKEPRLVAPSKTGTENQAAFIAAWGTETNVYEGLEAAVPLDIEITRTFDQGATFETVGAVSATTHGEFESQLRVDDQVENVYATWMDSSAAGTDARFARGGAQNPLHIDLSAPVVAPGGTLDLTWNAPGYEGELYWTAASWSFLPGLPTPYGTFPLNPDSLLTLSLANPDAFSTNLHGLVGVDGTAAGTLSIPDVPAASGIWFYLAFVTVPADESAWGFSDPVLVEIL